MDFENNYKLQRDLKFIYEKFLQKQETYFEESDEYNDLLALFTVYLFKHDLTYTDFIVKKNFNKIKLLYLLILNKAINCDFKIFEKIVDKLSKNQFEIGNVTKYNKNDLIVNYTKNNSNITIKIPDIISNQIYNLKIA